MIDSTEPRSSQRALERDSGSRASSTPSTWRTAASASTTCCRSAQEHGAARRRAHDRRDRHGQDARPEARGRATHSTTSSSASTGSPPQDLIFDDLTFTLATGEPEWIDSAVETIEGIRLIKRELPGVFTSLGVSNVSFGLTPEARAVLNSVFLHHCVEAGLDMAIVNPAHVQPYAEIPARRARAGRRPGVQPPRRTRCSASSSTSQAQRERRRAAPPNGRGSDGRR